MSNDLNDQYAHINDATHYLIYKRFELNFAKLDRINEFMTSMLTRILQVIDAINKRITDIMERLLPKD